jgi:DNA-binding NarL/FixJ family response regulator
VTRVLALVPDLIFAARIGSEARAAGVEVRFLRTAGELEGALEEGGAALVLLDLAAAGADALGAIAGCARLPRPPAVVAFGPHTDAALLAEARRLGARAMPRSAFASRLAAILRGAAALPSA